MHLVIISGATRPQPISNTAAIIEAFQRGFAEGGGTSETHFLSDRAQWPAAKRAFLENECILFALPLYVENVPGILLEFLEGLSPKTDGKTRLAFLLQGGFDEASQLRCCEEYLATLPARFGCSYAGTLLKGGMFGIRFLEGKMRAQLVEPFVAMGRLFSERGTFDTEEARAFAGEEYLSKANIRAYNLFGKLAMRVMMTWILKKQGGKGRLTDRPYQSELLKE